VTIKLIILTMVTLVIAVITLAQPWRERDWGLGALAASILAGGYTLAFLLVKSRELPSPIRVIERLTQAIISLFR
jgi:hypothetical protein